MEMNMGISSYCLWTKMLTDDWTLFDIMDWAKEHGCSHMELVPFGLDKILGVRAGNPNHEFAAQVKKHSEEIGLPLSAFSLNAHFVFKEADAPTDEKKQELFDKEIERVKAHMVLAHEMGIKKFRNDTCSGQQPDGINTPEQFEKDFPWLVKAVQILADFAATMGMSTTLENHGLYVNGADRVIRILKAANRPNVGLTVDVGNFLCVDCNPVVEVAKAIKYADMIHLKDFYIRDTAKMLPQDGMYVKFPDYQKKQKERPEIPAGLTEEQQKEIMKEWFKQQIPEFGYVGTAAGNTLLRGSIIGQGDMDMWKIISIIKNAGYEKEISLEFEGMEDPVAGTIYGLETAHYIWDKI